LVGTVGVHIDHGWCATGAAARLGDGGDDGRDATRVVPVPVRQEQDLDAREVDGQALAFASQTSLYGPTSMSTVAVRSPLRAVARAEKP
jgi:hypothetical protein